MWLSERLRDTKVLRPMKRELRDRSVQKRRQKQLESTGMPAVAFDPEQLSKSFALAYHRDFRFDLEQRSWASYDGRRWLPGGGNDEVYGRIFHHGNNEVGFPRSTGPDERLDRNYLAEDRSHQPAVQGAWC